MFAASLVSAAMSQAAEVARTARPKPSPPDINGASGIACQGKETEYATELWLEGPSAFWLHPEGPLSDKTPEEWLAEREREKVECQAAVLIQRDMYANALPQYQSQLALMQAAQQYGLSNQQYQNRSLLDAVFGVRF